MKRYALDEKHIPEWISLLRRDLLCIYPTDSLYGIGGIAHRKNADAVREVKGRDARKPISVIAPSVRWIREHCAVPEPFDFSYRRPITYLMRKRKAGALRHLSESDRIGVRLLPSGHVTQRLVATLQRPMIATSANYAGERVGASVEEMPASLIRAVGFVIDAGTRLTEPSVLYDAETGKEVRRS